MKHFYIITNHEKDPHLENTEKIRRWLEKQGCSCRVQDDARQKEDGRTQGNGYRYTNPLDVPEETDCVLVLGGDGTLLRASRDLVDRNLPLLGINMGKLGYLAEIELSGVFGALERVIREETHLEKRMMIEGETYRREKKLFSDIALNDIVICRRGHLRVVDFHIYVDGAFLCSYKADGIIVSTPTGSTGYSLSAGGPIVAPDASLMLLTAVAPHTISSRPVILPDNVEITVEMGGDREHLSSDGAEVNFDGDTVLSMEPGDRVVIRKSAKSASLLRVYHTSFVELLRNKLN